MSTQVSQKASASPLLVSAFEQLWRFQVGLVSISDFTRKPAEPKVLVELQLPLNNRLQVRLNYGKQSDQEDSKLYYDVLLVGPVFYPLKISASITGESVRLNGTLSQGSTVSIGAATPYYLAYPYNPDGNTNTGQIGSFGSWSNSSGYASSRSNEGTKLTITAYVDSDATSHANSSSTHSEQLATLLSSGKFADCKIVSREGSFYGCHKAILCLKSEVIEKSFESKHMAEAQNNQIQLDCNDVILNLILPYFYTGNLPTVPTELAIELHRVSHLYQIEGLTAYLADQISCKFEELVSLTNVLEFVVYADRMQLSKVKLLCLQRIKLHRQEIVKLPNWKEFRSTNGDLMDELFLM